MISALAWVGGLALGLAVTYVALNAIAYVLLRAVPNLLIGKNERLRLEYLDRFRGELEPFVDSWFDLAPGDWPAFYEEYKRGEAGIHVQEDFTELRHPAREGSFINYSEHGFRCGRDQGAWPPDPETFNVFFFGGSTALGVGPDWTTIPSLLQESLRERVRGGRRVCVYNFGRGSYLSTQERILFQQLLQQGRTPDVAIFLDGLNDFFFLDGRPATHGIYAQAMDAQNREQEAQRANRLAARPHWNQLGAFLAGLPLHQLLRGIVRSLGSPPTAVVAEEAAQISEQQIAGVIDRYLHNRRQIEAVAQEYGVAALFVWQPVPAYGYDLEHHVALHAHYGLHGHARSGPGYTALARLLESRPLPDNFLWLADLQRDRAEALYVDSVHYTAGFSRTVAEEIARGMDERKLVPVA